MSCEGCRAFKEEALALRHARGVCLAVHLFAVEFHTESVQFGNGALCLVFSFVLGEGEEGRELGDNVGYGRFGIRVKGLLHVVYRFNSCVKR